MNRLSSILQAALLALPVMCLAMHAEAGGRDRPDYEKLEEGPFYMRLQRIMVPVIHENDVRKLVGFILVVEFADPESRERAKLVMPRLMDAFRHDLHVLVSRPGGSEDMDLALYKRYLLASGKRVLGQDAVKDVLIERTLARKAE